MNYRNCNIEIQKYVFCNTVTETVIQILYYSYRNCNTENVNCRYSGPLKHLKIMQVSNMYSISLDIYLRNSFLAEDIYWKYTGTITGT